MLARYRQDSDGLGMLENMSDWRKVRDLMFLREEDDYCRQL
jgi:hypothetical protein